MKQNAIVRIILFAILAIVLIFVLLGGIGLKRYRAPGIFVSKANDAPVIPETRFTTQEIDSLNINWASGTIHIEGTDDDEITVGESTVDGQKPMVLKKGGSTLYVEFSEDVSILSFNVGTNTTKDLYITVPKDWDFKKVELDGASADVEVLNLTGKEFDIDTASGNHTFQDCSLEKLEMDTASGDLNYSGSIRDKLKLSGASAQANLILLNAPKSIKIDSVSGDLNLTLPENCGFTLEKDTLSGSFSSEFDTHGDDGKVVHGDGECKIEVEGVSASVHIRKG